MCSTESRWGQTQRASAADWEGRQCQLCVLLEAPGLCERTWWLPISKRLCPNSYGSRIKMLVFPPKLVVVVSPAPFLPRGGPGDAWDSLGLRGGSSSPGACAYMQWAMTARKPHTNPQGGHHHTATSCPTLESLSPWLLQNSFLAIEEKTFQGQQKKSQVPDGPTGPCWLLASHKAKGRL